MTSKHAPQSFLTESIFFANFDCPSQELKELYKGRKYIMALKQNSKYKTNNKKNPKPKQQQRETIRVPFWQKGTQPCSVKFHKGHFTY